MAFDTTNIHKHPVKQYVERVASTDLLEYPEWDLKAPLPKLIVPNLQDTLDKYLQTIKPVVSEEQYLQTAEKVKVFGQASGEGEHLQKLLEEYATTKDCWAYEFWSSDMYMKIRLPLPVNSNPGMVFPRVHFEEKDDRLRYAARFISGIMDYKVILDTRTLPVDRCRHREKGQPLCMEQYYRLFPSYRKPGIPKDSLEQPAEELKEPDYIIVACKNQFFKLDVVINKSRLSNDQLYAQLKRIYKMAEEKQTESHDIGVLTAADRSRWARARDKLMNDETNKKNLSTIEKCIFLVCLDDAIPISFNHQNSIDETSMSMRDDVSLAKQMSHGMGSHLNSCNRWFDKTMQFVIGQDGACGLCYEHSASEGIAVVQLIEHLLNYMEELRRRRLKRMQSMCDIPPPERLQWNISQELELEINDVKLEFDKMISDLDLYVLRFDDFGKNFPKSQNMSPDAFIQLVLQLTYYKVHHKLVSTYESASIRRFRHGRVDNIRACTWEALEWAKAMCGEIECSDVEKMNLLRKAIKKQTDILVQTILGRGIDNHLLGLREIAALHQLETPELFKDESYTMSNHFTLSTSQVPTTMDAFMLYGAVVNDGYGVCYNPHPDYMLMCVTSFKSCGITDSTFFASTIESSFMQVKELCLRCTNINNGFDRLPDPGCLRNGVTETNNNDTTANNMKKKTLVPT